MKLKTCYYCGTKYSPDQDACPLCGQTEIEQPDYPDEVEQNPNKKEGKRKMREEYPERRRRTSKKNSSLISTIICIVLALIVIIGIVVIFNAFDGFSSDKPAGSNPQVDLPIDQPDGVIACTAIDVGNNEVNLEAKGRTHQLVVTLEPSDCNEKPLFVSSDETVAIISQDGVITAMGPGVASLTITCGKITTNVTVVCDFPLEPVTPVVPNPPVQPSDVDYELLSLSLTDFTLFSVGETATIRVKGVPENAEVSVEWLIDDPEIATIENGKVTAVSKGTTKAYAVIDGKKELSCWVRCALPENAEPVDENAPKLSHTDVTLRKSGEEFTIRLYKDNTRFAGVEWSSGDTTICTVDEFGLVTAVGNGTTKITGVYEGKTYTCIVRCIIEA